MAQQKVVDLVVQRGSLQIVQRVQTTAPARSTGPDLRGWLVRSPASWRGLAASSRPRWAGSCRVMWSVVTCHWQGVMKAQAEASGV